MEKQDAIKIDTSNWNLKLENRKRGRMKITIKLSKEESEGFVSFMNAVKPEHIDDNSFCKVVFLEGIENMNNKLTQVATEYIDSQKDMLVEQGLIGEDATLEEIQEALQELMAKEQLDAVASHLGNGDVTNLSTDEVDTETETTDGQS